MARSSLIKRFALLGGVAVAIVALAFGAFGTQTTSAQTAYPPLSFEFPFFFFPLGSPCTANCAVPGGPAVTVSTPCAGGTAVGTVDTVGITSTAPVSVVCVSASGRTATVTISGPPGASARVCVTIGGVQACSVGLILGGNGTATVTITVPATATSTSAFVLSADGTLRSIPATTQNVGGASAAVAPSGSTTSLTHAGAAAARPAAAPTLPNTGAGSAAGASLLESESMALLFAAAALLSSLTLVVARRSSRNR